jgi:hypothetical protein
MNQWNNETTRSDGLSVSRTRDERWVIRHPNGMTIVRCPCCDLQFETMRSAKLCADAFWPAKS